MEETHLNLNLVHGFEVIGVLFFLMHTVKITHFIPLIL